jgi:soluble lytic murein transglycosylase-like protein
MKGSTLLRGLTHAGLLLAGGLLVGIGQSASDRLAADRVSARPNMEANLEISRLNSTLDELRGRLVVSDLKIERMNAVAQYSAAYRIPADLSASIYDAALAEGLHPSLGYQLVKVESGFRSRARSSRNALGLTQVRIATAREVEPAVTERQLLLTDTNLRIGFRVLRRRLGQFNHDLELALRAYNLGPTGALASLVDTTSTQGADYAGRIIDGVKGKASRRRIGGL